MSKSPVEEKDWFMLYHLAKLGGLKEGVTTTTQEIAESIGSSQQTVSRRINSLRDAQLIERLAKGNTFIIRLTKEGISELKNNYLELKALFEQEQKETIYTGKVVTGMGEGKYYVSLPNYHKKFTEFLGRDPFPGTLNLALNDSMIDEYFHTLAQRTPKVIDGFKTEDRTYGPVDCYEVFLSTQHNGNSEIRCLILDIRRTSHKKGTVEIVSDIDLRKSLNLRDNTEVKLRIV
jgi:riboflavin kinase